MKFKSTAEGLKQTLVRDYPGCKNITEAFELAKKKHMAEEMKKVIEQVREELKAIDFTKVDKQTREKLSLMKLESISEVYKWREAWLIEAKKINDQSSDP